jgi:Amt family ammonium transporter
VSFVFFKILDQVMGLRVSEEVEIEGLDQSEVAVTAYPDFNITKTHR